MKSLDHYQQESEIILREAADIGIKRHLESFYILGTYPPLIALPELSVDQLYEGGPESNTSEVDVYIHVPFCDQHCDFCHFLWNIGAENSEDPKVSKYLDTLKQEITLISKRMPGLKARSLYVGGGTPSFLSSNQITDLIGHFRSHIELMPGAQISFDIHPRSGLKGIGKFPLNKAFDIAFGDMTISEFQSNFKGSLLGTLKNLGVNRPVIGGVDILDAAILNQQRGHSGRDVNTLVSLLGLLEFETFHMDMIMGSQGQSLETWKTTLGYLTDNQIPSVAMFPLMFKASNPGWSKVLSNNFQGVPSIVDRGAMHLMAMEHFASNGYTASDIVYYFTRGSEDTNEQQVRKFSTIEDTGLLAIGPSSFGFLNGHMYYNNPSISKYTDMVTNGELPIWRGMKLSNRHLFERSVMFGLKGGGIVPEELSSRYGIDIFKAYGPTMDTVLKAGFVKQDGGILSLTSKGNLVAEEVCDLFAGDDIRKLSEKSSKVVSPKDYRQRFSYNMMGHRTR